MVNIKKRIKQLKQAIRQSQPLYQFPQPKVLFTKIKCHHVLATDDYIAEVHAVINDIPIQIKGAIDPDRLIDGGISIVTPKHMYTHEYKAKFNTNEMYLLIADAPNFHKLLLNYINHVGDQYDAGVDRVDIKDLQVTFVAAIKDEAIEPTVFNRTT